MLLEKIAYEDEKHDIAGDIMSLRDYYKDRGVNLGLSEFAEGRTHFINILCTDEMDDGFIKQFHVNIAEIVYKLAAAEYIDKYMGFYISDNYFFLDNDEIIELMNHCADILKDMDGFLNDDSIYFYNKKNSIVEKIRNCFKENTEINISGFLTFRMKELKNDFIYITDRILERYMVDREYEEFIKLLQYFVEIQGPRVPEVNIIIDEKGSYTLRDNKNMDMERELFSGLMDMDFCKKESMEDILISTLITNSPEKIIMHHAQNVMNTEVVETIVKVFKDRVTFCSGCWMCDNIKN